MRKELLVPNENDNSIIVDERSLVFTVLIKNSRPIRELIENMMKMNVLINRFWKNGTECHFKANNNNGTMSMEFILQLSLR